MFRCLGRKYFFVIMGSLNSVLMCFDLIGSYEGGGVRVVLVFLFIFI